MGVTGNFTNRMEPHNTQCTLYLFYTSSVLLKELFQIMIWSRYVRLYSFRRFTHSHCLRINRLASWQSPLVCSYSNMICQKIGYQPQVIPVKHDADHCAGLYELKLINYVTYVHMYVQICVYTFFICMSSYKLCTNLY